MTVDALTIDQVEVALKKIEDYYRDWGGNVDLIRMSADKNIFPTWRALRDKQRSMKRLMLK